MGGYNEDLEPGDLEYMKRVMIDQDLSAIVSDLGLSPDDVPGGDEEEGPAWDHEWTQDAAAYPLEQPSGGPSDASGGVNAARTDEGQTVPPPGGETRFHPLPEPGPAYVPRQNAATERDSREPHGGGEADHQRTGASRPPPLRRADPNERNREMLRCLGEKALARRVRAVGAGADESALLMADALVASIEIPLIDRFSVSVLGGDRVWNPIEKCEMVKRRRILLADVESKWRRQHSGFRGILRWLSGKQFERPDADYFLREIGKLALAERI